MVAVQSTNIFKLLDLSSSDGALDYTGLQSVSDILRVLVQGEFLGI